MSSVSFVTPAKAGAYLNQPHRALLAVMGPRLRGDDEVWNGLVHYLPSPSGEGIEGWGLSVIGNPRLKRTGPTPTPPLKRRGFQ